MPEKILLIGPVSGRLTELASKVSAIQSKHGPFTALFILGDLFHPNPTDSVLQQQTDLLEGKLTLSIATYFYRGTTPLPSPVAAMITEAGKQNNKDVPEGLVKVVENLYYAKGKSGTFTTPTGFRVAFVGGRWDAKAYAEASEAGTQFDPEEWYESPTQRSEDEALPYITPATIHRLLALPSFRLPSPSPSITTTSTNGGSAKAGTLAAARTAAAQETARSSAQSSALTLLTSRTSIDLLLTSVWPSGVTLFSTPSPPNPSDPLGGLPDGTARMWGSPAIARLASHGCPRYHFSLAPTPAAEGEEGVLPVGISEETLQMGAFWERPPYLTDLSSYLPQPLDLGTPAGRREAEKLKSVTRFVSLAKFANEKKRRWFLALNLTPAEKQEVGQVTVPGNVTQTPYFVPKQWGHGVKRQPPPAAVVGEEDGGVNYRFQEQRKRQRGEGDSEVPPKGYVCRICGVEGHYIRACPSKAQQNNSASTGTNTTPLPTNTNPDGDQKGGWTKTTMPLPAGLPAKPSFSTHPNANPRRQLIPVGPSNCWFCLSNPSVAKQLIITIGSDSYLVFPKGPFSHPSINSIPFNANHLLVVPLTHTSNLLPPNHPVLNRGDDLEEARERERVRTEMEETKKCVRAIWEEKGHVMLEWTLVRAQTSSRMTHFQTQLLALLSGVAEKFDLVKKLDDGLEKVYTGSKILRNQNEIEGYFAGQVPAAEGEGEQDGYFHLALHQGERKEWLIPLTTNTRFPVQFVRHTLAGIFELPQLADWKTSIGAQEGKGEEEEEVAVEKKNSAGFRGLLMSNSS